MEELEVEIVLSDLPDVPRLVEGLASYLQLEPHSLGMTSTLDRFVDTEDFALLSRERSLRVRQKLENLYSGGEFRLTYKSPLRAHERLFIRNEEKLKLADTDIDTVMNVLSEITDGLSGQRLVQMLNINELAREARLGVKGGRVSVSVDSCTYTLPGTDSTAQEVVLELESHGVSDDVILSACDWALKETGGRLAAQSKYARGLRMLGKL